MKTCAQCSRPFAPKYTSTQMVCSLLCARRLAKNQRVAKVKAERAETKQRKEALETIPKLIAKAQAAFNAFIRARDKDKGCFVCGRMFDPEIIGARMHAGHVRSRGAAGHLRFVEDNCLGECEGCNGPRGAKPHEIEAGAVARIGRDRFEELKNDNTPHKWTHEELRGIADLYRQKRRDLEKQEKT